MQNYVLQAFARQDDVTNALLLALKILFTKLPRL